MESERQVHPLRINKSSSPVKMASAVPRPLSELSPMEKRRNSPSWHQPNNASPKKSAFNTDSSPFQSSPLETATSPRLFWQNQNSENMYFGTRTGSPSPTRRSSIERLQRASRVKNSNILALEQKQEYDPTRLPQIERPLSKVQGTSFRTSTSSGAQSPDPFEFDRSTSSTTVMSPGREQTSPTKSSLSPSKFKSSFDREFDEGASMTDINLPGSRSLHRHTKSVTFDAAPPQINEYEMATPDLSSIGTNSREGSYESMGDEYDDDVLYNPTNMDHHEDSFDASLEDTDKTPVVGPDDWRGDSPMVQGRPPFQWEGSPMPDAAPSLPELDRPQAKRSDSANSEHRPLPPLPGAGHTRSQSAGSAPESPALSATAERMLGTHRGLPTPPAALASKSDIQNIGNGKMTLEERLKLMMLSDDSGAKSAAEQQRERRLRRANGRDRFGSPLSDSTIDIHEDHEADDTIGEISLLEDYEMPSRISRESIMRRVNGNKAFDRESDYNFSSPAPGSSPQRSPTRSSPERQLPHDPDVPIPSTEDSMLDDIDEEEESSVIINRPAADEYDDDSEMFESYMMSELETPEPEARQDNDYESNYSDQNDPVVQEVEAKQPERDEVTTPRASTSMQATVFGSAIPDLGPDTSHAAFSRDFESYMISEPEKVEPTEEKKPEPQVEVVEVEKGETEDVRPRTPDRRLSKPEYDGSGWGEPESDEEPGTPESVIHRPVTDDEYEAPPPPKEPKESVSIPERVATVKASGSKLKTRVSNTPSDLAAMREARRQVSHEIPGVPPIPAKHQNRLSRDAPMEVAETQGDGYLDRHPSFKNRSLTLDLDLGLSLDQDFERVIEGQKVQNNPKQHLHNTTPTQQPHGQASNSSSFQVHSANTSSPRQRGYLMRQNTKLVTATDKDGDDARLARSVGNSPVKEQRPQSWVVEPWNGKRKSSARVRPGVPNGPVPPMPGQQSNATGLDQVNEEEQAEAAAPETGERGRLFVKVMGVKDLDLPIPKNERSWFSLTLDNGVHCVTTAWLELARNAPIGQEFELVVPNDLEFQLTLNVKLDKPAPIKLDNPSVKTAKPKTSTFSRVFASPKKRKEMEIRQREEEERNARQYRDSQARQRNAVPTAYELLSPLAAEDGSFGRSYVCLKDHESRCFGRPYMAEVACFNEWAVEEASFASSVKSKRGNATVVRRAPYPIGKLELQLLFVPRPKNTTEEDMPKSMNSCIRELKATEERLSRNWEGPLSQQGGDCPYWRRRYFKLVGTKLTAYHETTRQPRASINLSNAKRLIDDRRALTEKDTLVKGGKRRRSAFAEEEEGYMFVEEGFRIRFNNGEVIDFYADTSEDKEGWMKVLSDVIGRDDGAAEDEISGPRSRAKWCELVLKREEQLRRRSEARRVSSGRRVPSGRRVHSRTKSAYV
ncbi:uncharacterized protein F5Z01DRAFT_709073 [Emericellopsis atlantica]|uniref:PH domain-containing protein n=1 Tax=Emericellopsis atlantica TaxID=2614577 RepID=A0A9P7ZJU7_9HYPO|nr:uncharacterized protein F5Z01DRAFT_709073 [Emericellopsis atlantica]KAG9253330.1 hypothetical protein F5Z01DRAFT_709073 [Emericellopsis atlantica]